MKIGIKCITALIIVATISFCVSASDTTTKFQTGPFIGSVDLGMPCSDIKVGEPVQSEQLSGASYTNYDLNVCDVLISLTRLDKDTFDLPTAVFGTSDITSILLRSGVDKDTVEVYDRKINSMSGAVGKGYIPKSDLTIYIAGFYVSPKSYGYIYVFSNETKMISALKTIHISEGVYKIF